MVTREDVESAYRMILGRDPENEAAIDWHVREHDSLDGLRSFFFGSTEFGLYRGRSEALTPATAFRAVYDRAPNEAELDGLARHTVSVRAEDAQAMLRAALTAFSRTDYATAVSVRFTERDLTTVPIRFTQQRLVVDDQDRSVSSTIIGSRDYEAHLGRFIRSVVGPGMVCVDIGANVGFHSFLMRELVGSEGHIYAFEPNSENCRMLSLSVIENTATNLTVLPLALSDRLGAVAFSPAVGSNGGFMRDVTEPLLHPNCSVVPTARLDDLISPERLDFIKIDVEGAEPLAMAGAEELVARHRPIVASEYSEDMIRGVSGMTGEEYIRRLMRDDYRAYTLGLSGPYEEIVDPAAFTADWPDFYRIEDLAFVPRESAFDFAAFSQQ